MSGQEAGNAPPSETGEPPEKLTVCIRSGEYRCRDARAGRRSRNDRKFKPNIAEANRA
jgi:hypothetical protein